LDKATDIFVTADHGFVTISHESRTSPSAIHGEIKSGFLAPDLASGLGLARNGNLLGDDAKNPDAIVVPNGGADLIYLPRNNAKILAGRIVDFLATQDYVSGLFVNDRLGKFPGALPMSALNLMGMAKTPAPSIYVNFRSFAGDCANKLQCAVAVHDTGGATGQGSHGSFSRAETRNFMAAIGPDFKTGYADPAPVSNADIAPTLAAIAGISLPAKGKLMGRVIGEARPGGRAAKSSRRTLQSEPAENGLRTVLNLQEVGETRYFDAAGFAGKTVGLTPP
jgi:arylsulfatase A-like enzyme